MRIVPPEPHGLGTVAHAPSRELDLAAVPELRARLAAVHAPGAQVVLDLAGVTFIDSSALSVVLAADRRLMATGGALRLAHVSAEVRRVLRICGLGSMVLPSPCAGGRRHGCRTPRLVR